MPDDEELYFDPDIPDFDLVFFEKFTNFSMEELKDWGCIHIPEDMWNNYLTHGRLPNYMRILPVTKKKKAREMGVIP